MSALLNLICQELGVEVVDTRLQHKRGPGQTCAVGTLEEILRSCGSEHLRSVLITIMESENNRRALVRPVILAVSDLLRCRPSWFGGKWLEQFDKIDLYGLYDDARVHRDIAATRHVLFGMLLDRLRPHFKEEPSLFETEGR